MSRFRELLLGGLSRLLEPGARDVIIGDLAELNLGLPRSVSEVCGMIARQQARLWNDWAPWLALLGIVGLVGIRLNAIAGSLAFVPWMNLRTYRTYGTGYGRGLTISEELILWISLAVAITLWSWTAGFAFTTLSRKTAPVTGTLLCLAWLCWNGWVVGRSLFVVPWFFALVWLIPSMLWFLPAVWGARRALRRSELSFRQAIILLVVSVSVIALVTWTSGWPQAAVEKWSEGVMHVGLPWYRRLLPYLLLSWPTGWIVATRSHHGGLFRFQTKSRRLE